MAELLALGSGFSFAMVNIFTQIGLRYISAKSGLFIVNLINALIFLFIIPLFFDFTQIRQDYNPLGLLFFILAGIMSALFGRYFKFASIEVLGSSRTSTLKPIRNIIVLFLGIFFLGERINRWEMVGINFLLIGICIVIFEMSSHQRRNEVEHKWNTIEGGKGGLRLNTIAFPLLTALSYALSDILRKMGLDLFPAVLFGAAINAMTAFFIYSIFFVFSGHLSDLKNVNPRGVFYFLLCSFFTAAAWFMWFFSLSLSRVSIVASLKNSDLIFTLLLSAIFLKKEERLNVYFFGGALFVFIGVMILVVT